ncbi:MAG: hypothetical protein IJV64_02980, partial [Oscillospiraceae bacterium]|nr:hypothetical protein [Oscillospiraceae bacterium]
MAKKDGFLGIKSRDWAIYAGLFVFSALLMETLLRFIVENIGGMIGGSGVRFRVRLLIEWQTWALGAGVSMILAALYAINGGFRG